MMPRAVWTLRFVEYKLDRWIEAARPRDIREMIQHGVEPSMKHYGVHVIGFDVRKDAVMPWGPRVRLKGKDFICFGDCPECLTLLRDPAWKKEKRQRYCGTLKATMVWGWSDQAYLAVPAREVSTDTQRQRVELLDLLTSGGRLRMPELDSLLKAGRALHLLPPEYSPSTIGILVERDACEWYFGVNSPVTRKIDDTCVFYAQMAVNALAKELEEELP